MVKVNLSGCSSFVNDADYKAYVEKSLAALEVLENETGAGNDFLGWKHLPSETLNSTLVAECEAVRDAWAAKNVDLVVVIGIGIFIANIVSTLLRGLLVSVGADLFVARITGNEEIKFSISKIAANVVKYLIALIFVVEGIQALGLPVLVSIGSAIIGYLPELLSVALIVLAGGFAAFIVDKALAKKNACKVCVLIAKALIYTVTAFLALIQLGIAEAVISTIFVLIIAALCVAFALAFG
ncbi:MAG: hypothetical protein IKK28_04075, partial [Mogibacterium sp.]|nr:hypothetical protein [Mogibacterium sp.]